MEDEKLKTIKEYLKLRKIEKEDNSTEMIKEMYKKVINNGNGENRDE